MMSAAAWGADSSRVARGLEAAYDSVDRIDSLIRRHGSIRAIDSVRREIRRRTGVALLADSIAPGYALDRALLALGDVVDSPLLVEEPLGAAPGVARESVIVHGELLAHADAGLEQVDGRRLLSRVQLKRAPRR